MLTRKLPMNESGRDNTGYPHHPIPMVSILGTRCELSNGFGPHASDSRFWKRIKEIEI